MEKIGKKQSSKNILHNKRTKKRGKSTSLASSTDVFATKLEDAQNISGNDEIVSIVASDGSIDSDILQILQDDIHSKGDLLLKNPRIDYVLDYRKSVQRLLKSVMPHLHKVETVRGHKGVMTDDGPSLKEYKFTLVTQVNEKLEQVVKIVYSTQPEQLKLMEALDEMRGLIINLLQ